MGKSQDLYKKAKKLIPGGTQLLSKRPEMFLPGEWPAYYSKSEGCRVWDLDGNCYRDMSYMGIGAAVLGYGDPDVKKSVVDAVEAGSLTTLNAPEEVELAELLVELNPWADMVRYAKTGGEAMAMAVRIARAASKKDVVLFCGYHGWHDWYLAANLSDDEALDGHLLPGLDPSGVPRALKGTVYPFAYNDTEGFLKLIQEHGEKIGAIVMEPLRNHFPDENFIKTVREKATEKKIPLVVDEITAGFRMNCGGAHSLIGLEPDIAVYGKAMSNGHPMAAVIGKREFMDSAQGSFISSTYWTDRIGPAAAITTIKKFRDENVHEHLMKMGEMVQEGWKDAAEKAGIDIHISGIYPLGHVAFEGENPLLFRTLYTQKMLELGFLANGSFYASYAHTEKDVKEFVEAVYEAFHFVKEAKESGEPEKYLKGEVCHGGFKRLT